MSRTTWTLVLFVILPALICATAPDDEQPAPGSRYFSCLTFADVGNRIVTGGCTEGPSTWELTVWDWRKRAILQRKKGPPARVAEGSEETTYVISLSLSADETTLAGVIWTPTPPPPFSGFGSEIRLWKTADLTDIRSKKLKDEAVFCLRLLPQPSGSTHMLYAIDFQFIMRLDKDLARQADPLGIDQHDYLRGIVLSKDGTLIAIPGNFGVKVRSLAEDITRVPLFRKFLRDGHPHGVSAAAFSPDGRVIATASGYPTDINLTEYLDDEARDYSVLLRDLTTGKINSKLCFHKDVVDKILFAKNGDRVLTVSRDQTVYISDTKTGKALHHLTIAADSGRSKSVQGIRDIAVSPDGNVVAGIVNGNSIYLWDVETGKLLSTLEEKR